VQLGAAPRLSDWRSASGCRLGKNIAKAKASLACSSRQLVARSASLPPCCGESAQRSFSAVGFWQSGETCRFVRNQPPASAFTRRRVWTLRRRLAKRRCPGIPRRNLSLRTLRRRFAKRRRPGIPTGSLAGRPTPHRASCLFFWLTPENYVREALAQGWRPHGHLGPSRAALALCRSPQTKRIISATPSRNHLDRECHLPPMAQADRLLGDRRDVFRRSEDI